MSLHCVHILLLVVTSHSPLSDPLDKLLGVGFIMKPDELHHTMNGIVSFSPDDDIPIHPAMLAHFPPNMTLQHSGLRPGLFGMELASKTVYMTGAHTPTHPWHY